MVGEYVTIDLSKIKPFNCLHYMPPNYLSISYCVGYCNLKNEYCQFQNCNEYHKKELDE